MSFQLTRTLLVHDSFVAMIQPLLRSYAEATRQEKDCVSLQLHYHQADAQLYVVAGEWRNEIAYLSHLDQSHYRHFRHIAVSMLLEPLAYPRLMAVAL